jgi:hypothetical protein
MSKDRAQEYRRQAEECLTVARTVSNLQGRASLEAMAQMWFRLADHLDRATRPTEAAAESRPVVQQQEQPQPEDDSDQQQ